MAQQVVATEEWVREKAQLSNVSLDEVETLSLEGSYKEKVVSLSDSLLHFKRLRSLDLSRNAIVSLEGLQYLQELEELSLYFNNIQSLEEISSLHHLIHLTELDLRLNPVTWTEENYRQRVIHLLPNLLKLDLRPVRAAERNPAKFHFISEEEYGTLEADKRDGSQQIKNDFSFDAAEQNYTNRAQMCKWDGASNNQSDDYKIYQSAVCPSSCSIGKNVCNRSREDLGVSFTDEILIKNSKLDSASCLKWGMPSTSQMPHQEVSSCDQENRESASVTEHINREIMRNKHSERQSKFTRANVEYIDNRLEARRTTSSNSLQPGYDGKATLNNLPETVKHSSDYHPGIPLGVRSVSSANISPHLQNLLDLVDQHWSGSNSLHRNQMFLNSAQELLFSALDSMAIAKIQNLEEKVQALTEENRSLLTRTASGLDSEEILHIKRQLTQKEDDLESLNEKFEKLIEENNKLRSQLKSLELANCDVHQRNKELRRENERLSLEAEYLQQQYEDYIKLQDSVAMLQDSHRAIMSSNNYLKELLNASSTCQRRDMTNLGSVHTDGWRKVSASEMADQPSPFKSSHHRNTDIVNEISLNWSPFSTASDFSSVTSRKICNSE